MATKVFAFFNPKGGVGKTSLSLLAASYLAYGCGKRVCTMDFEDGLFPVMGMRHSDLALLKQKDSELSRYFDANGLSRDEKGFYQIFCNTTRKESASSEKLGAFYKKMLSLKNCGKFDYILVDFPAGFMDYGIPSLLISSRILDICFVPTDVSKASCGWAKSLLATLSKAGVPGVLVWNRVSWYDRTSGFIDKLSESLYRKDGYEVCPLALKQFAKASRDGFVKNFVMSTVCWPEKNFRLARTEELTEFFGWIKERIDATAQ